MCFFLFIVGLKSFQFVIDANFVKEPEHAICQTLGGEVTFTCNATGKPRPSVTWERNGKELVNSSSFEIVPDGKGYSTLTVKNCGRPDTVALYMCKATNPPDVEKISKPAVLFFPCKCLLHAKLTPLYVHVYCSNFPVIYCRGQ